MTEVLSSDAFQLQEFTRSNTAEEMSLRVHNNNYNVSIIKTNAISCDEWHKLIHADQWHKDMLRKNIYNIRNVFIFYTACNFVYVK